mmetsp:Transcript_11772/g.21847  ORF Transcript_11772/g.21847 Transcript_11772/m.21847 type:complete len:256 (+) Transcript_11772:57-824(+)
MKTSTCFGWVSCCIALLTLFLILGDFNPSVGEVQRAIYHAVKIKFEMLTWKSSLAGGIAASIAEACVYPLDIAKVRMQLGLTPSSGFMGVIASVYRTEGLGGLFKGISPALMRQFVYQSLKMLIYMPIVQVLASVTGGKVESPALWHLFIGGGVAGVAGALITCPFDIIKARAQADTRRNAQHPVFRGIHQIYVSSGLGGLWVGIYPSMQRAFIINSSELAAYYVCKRFLIHNHYMDDNIINHFTSSAVSGLAAR